MHKEHVGWVLTFHFRPRIADRAPIRTLLTQWRGMFATKILNIDRRLTEPARRTDTRPRLLSQLRSPLVIPRFLNSSESVLKIVTSIVFVCVIPGCEHW